MSSPTADARAGGGAPGLAAEDIERRRRLVQQWRRHSALIKVLRRLLPALCVILVATLAIWASLSVLLSREPAGKSTRGMQIHMLNPNFQGRNEAGRPFLLSAASAVRDNTDNAVVNLDRPVFTLGETKDKTVVRARHGVYREDTRVMDLTGDVTLDDAKGNHFFTQHAVVDTAKSNLDGEVPIQGHGPLGRIAASSYAVRDGGAHVYFRGRVKSRIEHQATLVAPAGGKEGTSAR